MSAVHTLTDDWGREYEAFISEEIQEIQRPHTTVYQRIVVVDCVKYRGCEVKKLSEHDKLKVLDDWDTQARIADIKLNDLA